MKLDTESNPPRSGHSPAISAQLLIHGQEFRLASMGSDHISLRDARAVPAGKGIIRLQIDKKVILYPVELPSGVDPERYDQPYAQTAEATEELAA